MRRSFDQCLLSLCWEVGSQVAYTEFPVVTVHQRFPRTNYSPLTVGDRWHIDKWLYEILGAHQLVEHQVLNVERRGRMISQHQMRFHKGDQHGVSNGFQWISIIFQLFQLLRHNESLPKTADVVALPARRYTSQSSEFESQNLESSSRICPSCGAVRQQLLYVGGVSPQSHWFILPRFRSTMFNKTTVNHSLTKMNPAFPGSATIIHHR